MLTGKKIHGTMNLQIEKDVLTMITLQQDADKKLKTTIDADTLEIELKSFFGWRTPTKRYKTMHDRFNGLGTHDHDKFISCLVLKGNKIKKI